MPNWALSICRELVCICMEALPQTGAVPATLLKEAPTTKKHQTSRSEAIAIITWILLALKVDSGEENSPAAPADSLVCVRSIPVLPQWHVKDPGHSAKSAGGRLHLNTHTPLIQRCRSVLTMLLSRHNVGTYQETSLHATRQGTLGHSRLSSLSHCELILA